MDVVTHFLYCYLTARTIKYFENIALLARQSTSEEPSVFIFLGNFRLFVFHAVPRLVFFVVRVFHCNPGRCLRFWKSRGWWCRCGQRNFRLESFGRLWLGRVGELTFS